MYIEYCFIRIAYERTPESALEAVIALERQNGTSTDSFASMRAQFNDKEQVVKKIRRINRSTDIVTSLPRVFSVCNSQHLLLGHTSKTLSQIPCIQIYITNMAGDY